MRDACYFLFPSTANSRFTIIWLKIELNLPSRSKTSISCGHVILHTCATKQGFQDEVLGIGEEN